MTARLDGLDVAVIIIGITCRFVRIRDRRHEVTGAAINARLIGVGRVFSLRAKAFDVATGSILILGDGHYLKSVHSLE